MAHNLNETINGVAFAGVGKAWHGLGTVLSDPMNAEDALKKALLDYEVEKRPMSVPSYVCPEGKIHDGITDTGYYATVRTDSNTMLGCVKEGYHILQNIDAFKFFDPIIGRDEAIYETAGALGKGETIFLTAKLPDYIRVGNGDDLIEMYVVLTNNHSGKFSLQALYTPVRVVCQNTLNAAMYGKGTKSKIKIRHTSNMEVKLEEAHKIMGMASKIQDVLTETYTALSNKVIRDDRTQEIFKEFLNFKDNSTRSANRLEDLNRFYHEGVGQKGIVGSGWGVYNAMTGYERHIQAFRSETSRMDSILTNKTRSFDLAKAILA